MEHLLKLSGLLSEEDADGTDLKTLEERLARQKSPLTSNNSRRSHSLSISQNGLESARTTPRTSDMASPTSQDSPPGAEGSRKKLKQKTSDVETLSDMMCSLVRSMSFTHSDKTDSS